MNDSDTLQLHHAEYAAFHANYPSLVRIVGLQKPEDAGRDYALEERVAEIKAEIIAETPYLWGKSDRHHYEDIHEHLQYEAPLNARFARLLRAAVRPSVSDLALGMYFRALVKDAIKHQAELDLEKESDDEADNADSDAWYRSL